MAVQCSVIVAISTVLLCTKQCDSARILGVFQFPSLSHQIVYQPLWKELSLRGHQVTVVTPFPLKDNDLVNLTEIDVSEIIDVLPPSEGIETTMSKDAPSRNIMKAFYSLSEKIQEGIFRNKEFSRLYRDPNTSFDLIMVEALHPGMYSLSGRFNAPSIGISSLGVVVASHESFGNPIHPVLYPDMNLAIHDDLTLMEKFHSIYFSLWLVYYYNYHVIPNADRISRKYLGNDIPYLEDLGRNVSLLFVNTNPIIYSVRPNVPTVIPLGQMHLQPSKPLPKVLQNILDDATNGAIYFSLGSNVKSSNLPHKLLETITTALSKLPYTVLWKYEKEVFSNQPKNVIVRKWLPQQDILAHPNVKAFITQGGLQSIEEAIANEVPMIGMPFIGDQAMNVKKLVKAGIALEVDPSTVDVNRLLKAVNEIILNTTYKVKIREIKDILNDHPMTSLERAVWWTEYVIRHKGTKHLRSPTADVRWWQYMLLDVFGAVILSISVIILTVKKVCKIYRAKKIKTL